jgi:hypothetical protein
MLQHITKNSIKYLSFYSVSNIKHVRGKVTGVREMRNFVGVGDLKSAYRI